MIFLKQKNTVMKNYSKFCNEPFDSEQKSMNLTDNVSNFYEIDRNGAIAQPGERDVRNVEVRSSILLSSTFKMQIPLFLYLHLVKILRCIDLFCIFFQLSDRERNAA